MAATCVVESCPDSVHDTGDAYCRAHAVLADAGALVWELVEAGLKAQRYGVSLARLMREGVKTVPMQSEVGPRPDIDDSQN